MDLTGRGQKSHPRSQILCWTVGSYYRSHRPLRYLGSAHQHSVWPRLDLLVMQNDRFGNRCSPHLHLETPALCLAKVCSKLWMVPIDTRPVQLLTDSGAAGCWGAEFLASLL